MVAVSRCGHVRQSTCIQMQCLQFISRQNQLGKTMSGKFLVAIMTMMMMMMKLSLLD